MEEEMRLDGRRRDERRNRFILEIEISGGMRGTERRRDERSGRILIVAIVIGLITEKVYIFLFDLCMTS